MRLWCKGGSTISSARHWTENSSTTSCRSRAGARPSRSRFSMIGADTRLPIDPAANPVWPLARWMATNLRKFAGHIASDAVNGIPCSPLHSAYWPPTFRAPMLSNRIVRCAVFLLLFSFLTAQSPAPDHELRHRGFVMNMSAVEHQSNIVALTAAMRHQLDIAADSGAKPEIL